MRSVELTAENKSSFSSAAFTDEIDAFLRNQQIRIAIGLCLFAMLRILICSAAFPLFNSIDEHFHFDTVYEYAHGVKLTKDLPLAEPEVARVLALYDSGEYLTPLQVLRHPYVDVPIEQLPPDLKDFRYHLWFNYWRGQVNYESQSPPAYYMVASVWYRIGEAFGAKGWPLAYWMRFFNAVVYALFVWISYLFAKIIYPDRPFLFIGAPALLAVFPQDVFFGMNRDILSPLLAATILLLLFRSLQKETSPIFLLASSGFLTGIAFLTDVSNLVLYGVLFVVFYIRGRNAINTSSPSKELTAITTSAVAALLPPILWMAHNRAVTGDLTGSKAKMARMAWTVKPWHEMWQHPIFSLHGVSYFLQQLMRTYWRGELYWHGDPMRWPLADTFYVASSYFLLIIFAIFLLRSKSLDSLQRLTGFLSLYLLLGSFLFLAALSLVFDFHQCFYPSRAYPYFVSGRIITGTLLPFAIIYTSGLDCLFRRIRNRVHPIIPLTICCLFAILAQVVVSREVFPSPFNFFSLLKA